MAAGFDTVEGVILMDLNVALSSNFSELRKYPMATFIRDVETYRQWMVDLLSAEYVILLTAREARWRDLTLERIKAETGWQPQEALFNDSPYTGKDAPLVKEWLLDRYVYPRRNAGPERFMAIESNIATRRMYSDHGIYAIDCERNGTWPKLPSKPIAQDALPF